jgi:hypothetical protein
MKGFMSLEKSNYPDTAPGMFKLDVIPPVNEHKKAYKAAYAEQKKIKDARNKVRHANKVATAKLNREILRAQ